MSSALIQKKVVRDLCWMFESPALLPNSFLPSENDLLLRELLERNLEKVRSWSNDSRELDEYLKHVPRVYKLGIYAESLLRFALERFDGVTQVVSNLAVYREKQALGEFDFCVQFDADAPFTHWELAVKFYLCRLRTVEELKFAKASDWVGPAGVDTLELKLAKMTGRQLSLADLPEGRAVLKQHGIEKIQSKILSRGRLFYYWKLNLNDLRFSFISDDSLKGKWCPFDEFDEWAASQDALARYFVVPRLGWLSDSAEYPSYRLDDLKGVLNKHFETETEALAVFVHGAQNMRYFFTFPGFPNLSK